MNPASHPFSPRPGRSRRLEGAVFWIFRAAAYLILACGAAVFLDIVVKGGGTVFQSRAPFVNFAFLTEAPESLYVFEWEGRQLRLGDREYRAFKEAHPAAVAVPAESYVYSSGGIFPCIVGTLLLVVGSMSIALFLGVCAAIYLNEYARDGRFIRFVRLAIL
ncbi:MAG: hypothetical protein RL479_2545, partial [Verrucomicrobiota bacterium]